MAAMVPSVIAGDRLDAVAQVGDLALSVWSKGIRHYDKTIGDLNTEWAAAKAANFGVGGLELNRAAMKPAGIDAAVAEHIEALDAARAGLWADLVRREHKAANELDSVADGVAALLNHSDDPDIQRLAASAAAAKARATSDSGTDGPRGELYTLQPGHPDALGAMGNYDGNPVNWTETLAFIFADPRQCIGDDASWAGCGFEVLTFLPTPITKGLKVGKYAKRAADAADAARAADKADDAGSAAKIGSPNEFDPNSLHGMTANDVRASVPDDWVPRASKSGGGEVYIDPGHGGRQVRIMPGYEPGSRPDAITTGPYVVVSQNGDTVKIPLAGNPTLG